VKLQTTNNKLMLTRVCDTYLYEYLNHQLYHNK